jgi:hypothetical protein
MENALPAVLGLIMLVFVLFVIVRARNGRGGTQGDVDPSGNRRAGRIVAPIEVGTDLPAFNVIALGGQETMPRSLS